MKRIYQGKFFDIDFNEKEISIGFKMEVEIDSNFSFKGTVWEDEFSIASNKYLIVNGYIDNDHISFVKTYPCLYEFNEEGELVIDESKKGHEVIYDGYWDKDKKYWTGEWEVEGETAPLRFNNIVTELFIGPFEMWMIE
ncbi:MAG: hypothetical protein COA33_001055 [Fluviicola sp.]|nr:hypothetical protein [Fluviicola sp.]